MSRHYFKMSSARHVEVRKRSFHDTRYLVKFCKEVKYLAEPVVLLIASHGTPKGISVGGEIIGYNMLVGGGMGRTPSAEKTYPALAKRMAFVPTEDVLNVAELEKPDGVIIQFGGQTPLKIAHDVTAPVLGSSPEAIDLCEDRERFAAFLEKLNIPQPQGTVAQGREEQAQAEGAHRARS